MIIDLGNNYINGAAEDNLKPRKYGAEKFRAVVYGVAGNLPIEATVTHIHLDHNGMTGTLMNRSDVTLWVSDKENAADLKKQHGIDPSVYTVFMAGEKSFGLGGTVFILKKDGLIFTGDAGSLDLSLLTQADRQGGQGAVSSGHRAVGVEIAAGAQE